MWAILLVWSIIFSVAGMNFMRHIAVPGASNWSLDLSSFLVKDQNFTYGPTSGGITQDAVYARVFWWMTSHTVSGGILCAIAPFQFYTPLRNAYPTLHRYMGYVWMALVGSGQVGAFMYLWRTPAHDVYSHWPFEVLLYLLNFGTVLTSVLSLWAILKRDIRMHKKLQGMNYALLLSAPHLRGMWFVWAAIFKGSDMSTINLAVSITAGPGTVLLGFLFSRLVENKTEATRVSLIARSHHGLPVKFLLPNSIYFALQVIGIAGYAYIYHQASQFTEGTSDPGLKYNGWLNLTDFQYYFTYNYVPYTAISFVLLSIGEWHCHRKGDSLGVFEWRNMMVAFSLAPFLVYVLRELLFSELDRFTALLAGVINAVPLAYFIGFQHSLDETGLLKTLFPTLYSSSASSSTKSPKTRVD